MRAQAIRASVVLALVASVLAAPQGVSAAADVGVEGPSYAGASGAPTGEKPESKAWFNDGTWWASLWDTASSRYEIFRLNTSTQAWSSTNVALDTRSNSRADTLWDGSKLYVASHVFSESPASGYSAVMYRFSYSAVTETYSLDAGWPQQISSVRSESLVVDKDSTGQLWATWTQGANGSREVWVNRTLSGDSNWGTPFKLPVNNITVADDDISSLVAFGGNRIGVFWSNQRGASFHFAIHDDSGADATWQQSVGVFNGSNNADDHMNLKSLQTDGSGRVFAVVKTSRTGGTSPSIVLLVRSNSAVWTPYTIWTRTEGLTRPIVLLDTSNNRIHAFASKESGGPVYTKTSSLSSISFSSGLGTMVMHDHEADDINDATSTKQNVTSASGLLVLASNDTTDRYWHHFDALGGGGGGPTAPSASFTATPSSGTAPLAVSFTDTSSGSPTEWAWDFTDDGTVDASSPQASHTYTAAGTYTARLTVDNGAGSNSTTRTITVSEPGGGGGTTLVPQADAYVRSDSPGTNSGSASTLRARKTSSLTIDSYLKFTVSGVGSVDGATLRLFVRDGSPDGGAVHAVADSSWTETGITWTNRPAPGALLADIGAVSAGSWVELDVSDLVTGDGTYSLAVLGAVSDLAIYDSREGANDPQLVLTAGGGGGGPTAPSASFTATPSSGTAPLAVSFTDTSSGSPTEWAWDFTDDGTVDASSPQASHTYTAAGTYTARLTVDNGAGSNSTTRTITVSEPGGGGGTTLVASHDTYVDSGDPAIAKGNAGELRVRAGSRQLHTYLKFTVSGVGSVAGATLRLFVTEASVDGGSLYLVPDNSWTESSLTWSSKPPTSGAAIDSLGAVALGTWVELDVSSIVTGDGTYSFALISASNDVARYRSSEASTNRPELVLTAP